MGIRATRDFFNSIGHKQMMSDPVRTSRLGRPRAEVPLLLVASWGMPVGMSFGQPGFPQSLLVSRQVFSTSIRAKHVFEIRNTQRGI
jgi:hypothetical protein